MNKASRRQFLARMVPNNASSAVTPAPLYTSCNPAKYQAAWINSRRWQLTVTSHDAQSMAFDLAALKHSLVQTFKRTVVAPENAAGGGYIGTANWTGVPLIDLVSHHLLASFSCSIRITNLYGEKLTLPIDVVLQPQTLLIWQVDAYPLSIAQGAPARLLIPGICSLPALNAVRRIELISEVSIVPSVARIRPQVWFERVQRIVKNQVAVLRGFAFAGGVDIRNVVVSLDGGAWMKAQVHASENPLVWSEWRLAYKFPVTGYVRVAVQVQAADGNHTEYHIVLQVLEARG